MSRKLVSLIPHQPEWLIGFNAAQKSLGVAAKHLREVTANQLELHHIGSISIFGIHAKPILDILGVVSSIEQFDKLQHKIESLGFVWRGEYGIANRRYCVL